MDIRKIEERLTQVEETLATLMQKTQDLTSTRDGLRTPHTKHGSYFEDTTSDASPPSHYTFTNPLTWLGFLGFLCFVGAAVLLIKLSWESGWLSPDKRLIGTFIFGIVLSLLGLVLKKRDHSYSVYLIASGYIVMCVSVVGSYFIYRYISMQQALIVHGLLLCVGMGFYTVIRHGLFGIIVAMCAYSAPSLFLSHHENIDMFIVYFYTVPFIYTVCGVIFRLRASCMAIAYISLPAIFLFWIGQYDRGHMLSLFVLSYVCVLIGMIAHVRRDKNPLTSSESYKLMPPLILFYIVSIVFIKIASVSETILDVYALGMRVKTFVFFILSLCAGALTVCYVRSERSISLMRLVVLFWGLMIGHGVYFMLISDEMQLYVPAVLIFGVAFILPRFFKNEKAFSMDMPTLLIILCACAPMITYEVKGILEIVFDRHQAHHNSIPLILTGLSCLILHLCGKKYDSWYQKNAHRFSILAFHIFMLMGLYIFAAEFYHHVPSWLDRKLYVSVLWVVYTMVTLTWAMYDQDRFLMRSVSFPLSVLALKVLLFEVTYRHVNLKTIMVLLGVGIMLYSVGWRIRKSLKN